MPTRRQPPSDAAPDQTAAYEQKIEQLEAELGDVRAQHVRLAADFDNYKKRARQEQSDIIDRASAGLVERLLPVLDDFQRALEHAPEGSDEAWVKGLTLSVQKLDEVLMSQGLTPIEAVGAPFDPRLHEAIGHEETEDQPEDTVVTELRRGYLMRDRVVRPALVRVARPPI